MSTSSEPAGRPIVYHLADAAATVALGEQLARVLEAGSMVLLEGALGAGKTTLVRGLLAGLGGDPDEVVSPTFTLISVYQSGRLPLHHVDLYRLTRHEVAGEPVILEALAAADGIVAVEWAERLPLPVPQAVRVQMRHAAGNGREAAVLARLKAEA